MDPDVVRQVDERLRSVAAEHGVAVPWAIESGSRAWGFPSPDSDYDCRFVFVRRAEEYLSPWRPRDVIETPLDGLLDVSGWDLVKAVQLAVTGNATLGEWLRSPLVYAGDPAFRAALLGLVAAVTEHDAVRRHYLHVGRQQWDAAHVAEGVRLKRVLYAVRAAATLRWMDAHDGVPPMSLSELRREAPLEPDVSDALDDLLEEKSRTRELGTGRVPDPVRRFVESSVRVDDPDLSRRDVDEVRAEASGRFAELVEQWSPGGEGVAHRHELGL
jgi:hypothetical protein